MGFVLINSRKAARTAAITRNAATKRAKRFRSSSRALLSTSLTMYGQLIPARRE